ncbi:MAG: class I SAM-dependent methyltransferase [Planctomycetia bacterium]
MKKKNFDGVASSYLFLETITFGNQLQKCRTSMISHLTNSKRVLVLGEGNGRFLEAFCKVNPLAEILVIDESPRMLDLAKRRIANANPPIYHRIEFRCANVFEILPLSGTFDLIVCNFFLDCFTSSEIGHLLGLFRQMILESGLLVVGDFRKPDSIFGKFIGEFILKIMHVFFEKTAGISATELTDLHAMLLERSFQKAVEKKLFFGFLNSSIWKPV